jgi:hypothetical protein
MSPNNDITVTNPVEVTYDNLDSTKLSKSDLVLIEAKRLASVSKELHQKIRLSKTKPKKDYFKKKLKKNNDILGDMLIRLNKLHQIQNKKEK